MRRRDWRLIAVGVVCLWISAAGSAFGQAPDATEGEAQIQELLRAKLAEIARLQAEVERLRQAVEQPSHTRSPRADGPLGARRGNMGETPAAVRSGRPQPESKPQIMVRLKLLAVNLDELRRAGFELLSLQQLLDSDTPTSFLDDRGTIAKFLALLQEQCLVKTLAEPALVTVAGRRAEFATSALRYECTPDLAADGALRLGIQLKLDGPAADATGEASAALPSSTRSLAIATTVQMRPGQTLILAGPQARGQDRSTTGILLLVNADLVKAQPDDLKSH